MRCHSVGCGMANRMQSAMQSDTQSFSADHIAQVIDVFDGAGDVIETHEHAGEFKGDFVTRLGKRHARA
jgi:hypothetical protein